MSTLFQPTGLQLQGKRNNDVYSGEITQYPLTTNNTVVISKGDSVGLVAGSVVAVTANPASGTLSANTPIGVVIGFTYQSKALGFRTSSHLPVNAISGGDISQVLVFVADNPFARFCIQANGSIAASALGGTIGMGGFGADDVTYGVSRVYADVATLSATATQPFRIVGFDHTVLDVPGDAFTNLYVSWNSATHYYSQAAAH